MRPKSLLFIFMAFTSTVSAHGFKSPEAAIESYITAVQTGSGKHIEMAFAESASIQYYDEQGDYKVYSRDSFAKLVNSGNQWDASIEITSVRKTGNAANATVEFAWGSENQKGYVDYLNLIYDGKSWHISDKVAQFVPRE